MPSAFHIFIFLQPLSTDPTEKPDLRTLPTDLIERIPTLLNSPTKSRETLLKFDYPNKAGKTKNRPLSYVINKD